MRYWVYVHTCPNGKRYVGCTTRVKPELRWAKGNGYYQNKHFYSAILKYGWSSIKHEAWELTSESEMYYAEKYLIAYYHTTENEFGYNHSSGGSGSLGYRHSEEARRKISEARKGKPVSEEARKHMAEAQKKAQSDPEVRRKKSEALKGRPRSEKIRKKIAEVNRKRWADPEYRKKQSETQKKVHSDPEYRKKISEACRNQPRIKIKLPDGTILERTKNVIVSQYINKGKKFEYVS